MSDIPEGYVFAATAFDAEKMKTGFVVSDDGYTIKSKFEGNDFYVV
jgi:hypothetical protein